MTPHTTGQDNEQIVRVSWATFAETSRGRLVAEKPSATRSPYQRDRDRIIHSGAFRKLRNKTQVFVESEGDYYRTRLTHSLEVAQIARSIARVLGLDEDLTETLALAHDLGHTCFGHAGEDALAAAMAPYGGFSHNDQTVRIVTVLEQRYLAFDGLNLTWETLEGCVKKARASAREDTARTPTVMALDAQFPLDLHTFPSAEAQVAGLADDIAYNTHDLDDGFRAGLFPLDDVRALPLFGESLRETERTYPHADPTRHIAAAVRHAIGRMVNDALITTRANVVRLCPQTAADIRHAAEPISTLSTEMVACENVIRAFLHETMYRHPRVRIACAEAAETVRALFTRFMHMPNYLPEDWRNRVSATQDESTRARLVADYIAGMTDRYARVVLAG